MMRLNNHKEGLVLVTVIIFVLILSILAIAILFIMTSEARLTERQIKRIKAGYAVQAGIQHYLNLLKSNPDPGPVDDLDVDGMMVDINKHLPSETGCPDSASADDPDCVKATVDY